MSSRYLFQLARSTRRRCRRSQKHSTLRHLHTYGHDNRGEPVQIVSIRLAAIGTIPPLMVRDMPADRRQRMQSNPIASSGSMKPAPSTRRIYDRRRMSSGLEVAGPAVIESLNSTILVPPGWQAKNE